MNPPRRRPRAPRLALLAVLASSACGGSGETTSTAPDVPLVGDGGADASDGAPIDAGPPCATGQARCGGTCIPVTSDPMNCGACGVACGAGLGCFGGACGIARVGLDATRSLTAAYGNEMIGANILDSCLPGEVLTGLQVEYRDFITRLGGVCSVLDANERRVALTEGHTTGLRGQQGGTAATLQCPAGMVVVGLEGRAGLRVNQLSLRCAPVTLTGDGPLTVTFGTASTVGPAGAAVGEMRAPALCPPGQVASSVYVHVRDAIDGVSLGCKTMRAFALVRGAAEDRPMRGNGEVGTLVRDVCPDGQVFTGVRARVSGGQVVGTQVQCGRVVYLAGMGPWNLAVGAAAPFEERGATSGTLTNLACRERSIVAGASGRAGAGVTGLQLRCAEPAVSETGAVSFLATTDTAYAGGTGGEAVTPDACPAGSVAIGANVRTSTRVESFGLICAPFTAR